MFLALLTTLILAISPVQGDAPIHTTATIDVQGSHPEGILCLAVVDQSDSDPTDFSPLNCWHLEEETAADTKDEIEYAFAGGASGHKYTFQIHFFVDPDKPRLESNAVTVTVN